MRQKILLLGGSYGQVPAIKEAKRRGLHTILCDYLPDNPGRDIADEFFLVSTTDKEKVLRIAQENEIDAILAYSSDPAASTSAYVSEKMGLKGNSVESVERLTEKDRFREFQKRNKFSAPDFLTVKEDRQIPIEKVNSLLPAVVKPVDSSDTKGVTLIKNISELEYALNHAFKFTRCGRVIIEQAIGKEVADLNGDAFVIDGKLEFCELGDHLSTSVADPLKPSSTFFPSRISRRHLQRVEDEIAKLIEKIGFKFGPVNIEARINARDEIYIMEVGPRNGGNYIPQAIYHSSGFDMLKAIFDLKLNKQVTIPEKKLKPTFIFTLHSNVKGTFDSFTVSPDIKPFVIEQHLFVKRGDVVNPFNTIGSSIGVLIFSFDSVEIAERFIQDFYQKVVGGIKLQS